MVEGAFDTSAEEIIEGLPVIHTVPHAANDLCVILSVAYNDMDKMDSLEGLKSEQLWQIWQACNYYQMYMLRQSVSMLMRQNLHGLRSMELIKMHCAARDVHDAKLAAAAFAIMQRIRLPSLSRTLLLRHLDDAHLDTLVKGQFRDIHKQLENITVRVRHLDIAPNTQCSHQRAAIIVDLDGLAASIEAL